MHHDYPQWIEKRTKAYKNRISELKKVEQSYGDLDVHFANGTLQDIINDLEYTTDDERANKPNSSKIKLGPNVNIKNNLYSYKQAVRYYQKFLDDNETDSSSKRFETTQEPEEIIRQKLSIESDMQNSLRQDILSLGSDLKIIDNNQERPVISGKIDITCEDTNGIVVIELKAGKADSRSIGQILGYIGDLQEEEEKPVRGILIAHDFDQRTISAARAVPILTLKKYSIKFEFSDTE